GGISEVLGRANIVCLPSYREGLPKVLLEAASKGRAIVTTDVPGCREVVRQGENGVLVPARDPEALAKAIENLIMNGELRESMGKRGRKIAEAEFSVDKVIDQTLALYQELLN
ncbi:MAG TPA: glycosyltransferase, partial [Candidatus Tenderia electrophaga]|nr:glycosyltransferase [Candidatus Tenderia electrophaga]